MTSQQEWADLTGSTAIDADGDKIGTVGQVYISNDTDQPEWVTVNTGLFGTRENLAPLYNAQLGQGELRLAVTKQQMKEAPSPDLDDEDLDPAEIDALYRYYADYLAPDADEYADAGPEYVDASADGAGTGSNDGALTRSGERPQVGTESTPAQRVRLRKYVVTEYLTQTVPGGDEEVRVEIEPIDEPGVDADLRPGGH
jgi:hypothetical protein